VRRYEKFESISLQRGVCELSVPKPPSQVREAANRPDPMVVSVRTFLSRTPWDRFVADSALEDDKFGLLVPLRWNNLRGLLRSTFWHLTAPRSKPTHLAGGTDGSDPSSSSAESYEIGEAGISCDIFAYPGWCPQQTAWMSMIDTVSLPGAWFTSCRSPDRTAEHPR
jgi:hypothetical protein